MIVFPIVGIDVKNPSKNREIVASSIVFENPSMIENTPEKNITAIIVGFRPLLSMM
jgi:hypothetical protein